ncbi:efflux RND transporter permease subunit [Halioxenophilus sp. WMMB6]|uniref:efflux RND transporter permease subunit n=1 Tax=Halioxenophilus sp. WMMB6 TaxID=3073815 RepID=UPI00295F53C2|nr:MMPL family transporter [Halioxenophilus sp. WMMB6]
MSSKASQLVHFATGHRKLVFWVVALLAVAALSQFPRMNVDTDPENMLPASNPERQFHNLTKSTFAMRDTVVVGVVNDKGVYNPTTLDAVYQVTKFADSLEGVVHSDLMSLANVDNISQGEPGTLRFEWMMPQPPADAAAAGEIKTNAERIPLLNDTLVSGDAKAAAIYITLENKNSSWAIAKQVQGFIDQLPASAANGDQWHITGLPVAEDRFGVDMFIQMGISAPLAGLMIFVLLWVFFRNVAFITAPMLVAMATVVITMGALIGAGFTVHIMSSMIAIFLMPIAVVDSVHILSEFSDRYKPGDNAKAVIEEVMGHLFTPMLYTSITSTVGFLSLMMTPIPPVQIFGAFVGGGIMLAFLLTITFIPAYISGLSEKNLAKLTAQQPDPSQSKLAGVIRKFGHVASHHGRWWIAGFAALFAISVYGISQIKINDNPVRWFKAGHELRVADRVLNEHFAGTYDAYLVLSSHNDIKASLQPLLQNAQQQASDDSVKQWLGDLQAQLAATDTADIDLTDIALQVDDQLFSAGDEDAGLLENLMNELDKITSQQKAFVAPEVLHYMEKLQAHLQASGLVGKSNSLADIVKTVNRELRSGENSDFVIPDSSNAVAQTLLQYQSSHRPQDLWHFVTPDYQQSLIWLQLTSGDNQDMTAVVNLVADYVAANPLPQALTYRWAGKAYLNVIWQKQMVEGMIGSLIGAFITVLVIMIFLFRSVAFGLLAMLPLTLTISLIYGLVGLIGKDYDMPIAILSALTLGLSVDFAIHFIERLRATFARTQDWSATMAEMFEEPGRAISRNAIVIAIGFTPLLFAPLVPYITVGVLLGSIMAISAIVTLIVIPAVAAPFKKQLFKTAPQTSEESHHA